MNTGDTLTVTSDCTTTHASRLVVARGETVKLVSLQGEWLWCSNSSGHTGYVAKGAVQAPASYRTTIVQYGMLSEHQPTSPDNSFSSDSEDEPLPGQHYEGGYLPEADVVDNSPIIYEEGGHRYYRVVSNYITTIPERFMLQEQDIVKTCPCSVLDSERRLYVECLLGGDRGFVPLNMLTPATCLDLEPWYLGTISRGTSEALLKKPEVAFGTFLIRESESTTGFVICSKSLEPDNTTSVSHRKIQEVRGKFCSWREFEFNSIKKLVEIHTTETGRHYLGTPFNKFAVTRNCVRISQGISFLPPPLPYRPATLGRQHLRRNESTRQQLQEQTAQAGSSAPLQQDDHLYVGNPPSSPLPSFIHGHLPQLQNATPEAADLTAWNQNVYGEPPPPSPRVPHARSSSYQASSSSSSGQIYGKEASVYGSGAALDRGVPQSSDSQSSGDKATVLDQWYVNPKKVKKLDKLGSGYYGEVWRATLISQATGDRIVAMKTLNPNTMQVDDFLNEAQAMKELRHPSLVRLVGMGIDDTKSNFLLMDYYINGSLYDYCKKRPLSMEQNLVIVKRVAAGMSYLSELNYIHRDLAARNVLLADDLTPRVADFGLARLIKSEGYSQMDDKMPWKWTAPEALVESGPREWSTKCDVWSYGVFCWELYNKCKGQPYQGLLNKGMLLDHLNDKKRLLQPSDCNKAIYSVMKKCWEMNPAKRINFKEIEKKLDNI